MSLNLCVLLFLSENRKDFTKTSVTYNLCAFTTEEKKTENFIYASIVIAYFPMIVEQFS